MFLTLLIDKTFNFNYNVIIVYFKEKKNEKCKSRNNK